MGEDGPRATLTGPALRDLDEAWRWIDQQSGPNRADAVVREIKAKADLFAGRPSAGRPQPALGGDIRSYVCHPYIVYYRPRPWGIEVVRVLHTRRERDAAWRGTPGPDDA